MFKSVVLAALLSGVALAAYAQTPPSKPPSSDAAPPERMVSTGDFNVKGDIAGGSLIGTKVRNADKQSIGKVDEVYLDKDAKVTVVVIAVGGFLGVGSKDVGVKWSDLTFTNEDDSLVVTTSLTKDALMALPDYTKTDRRKPAPPETAAAPGGRPNPRQTR